MEQIHALSKTKTVILISHRLANAAGADTIYVLDRGRIAQSGNHSDLLASGSTYAKLWNAQQELEHYTRGGAQA
jgi:ATP-binding cassette subfamily C protein